MPWKAEIAAVAAHDLTPAVHSLDQMRQLDHAASALGKLIAYHLKIDSGMGRLLKMFRHEAPPPQAAAARLGAEGSCAYVFRTAHWVPVSRGELVPNPHPLIEVSAGPIFGTAFPLLLAIAASLLRLRARKTGTALIKGAENRDGFD